MIRIAAVALATALACLSVASGQTAAPEARPSLGINLAGPADWNTELPFVDAFRLSRAWISQKEGAGWGKGPELELDEHGWIKRLEPGCFAETPLLTINGGHYPSGRYTLLYEGKGTIEMAHAARIVEGSDSTPGKLLVDVDASRGGIFLRLKDTDPADPVRNIRFVMPGFEETYEAEPFHPVFLNRWKGFTVIRFMDWMHTNDSKIKTWDDRPKLEDATWTGDGGIPLEVMIDFANRVDADPWFCMPHLADDEYVRQFAAMVKEKLESERKVYVEYSNEVWNGQFGQQKYAGDEGLKLKLSDSHWGSGWHFYARRSVQMFDLWHDVWADDKARVVRVLASQAGNVYVAEQILSFQDAGRKADALSIAPYFGMNVGPTSKPDVATVEGWTVDQVLDHLQTTALPESIDWMAKHKALADRFGLTLNCYEAGQHAVGIQGGENHETITKLLHAANRHPRMGELYTRYFDAWKEAGGDVMCVFSSVGEWSKWGSWGLAEHYDETPSESPKLRATLEWAAKNGQPVTMEPQAAK